MSDGYVCEDVLFAAALSYIFGDDSLLTIEFVNKQKKFRFDIPSLDGEEYLREFKSGTLAISDLMSYSRTYNLLMKTLWQMNKDNDTTWTSPSWIAGRKSTGEKIR